MTKQATHKRVQTAVWVLLICAIYGLVASFVLTYDRLELLKDPTTIPACTINPIISCSAAMTSAQAEILGIPNSVFGIAIYAVLLATSVFVLLKTKFSKVIWYCILAAAMVGTLFMHYLLIDSIFFLHIVCPWCFGIWLSTPLVFMSVISLFSRTEHIASTPTPLRTTVLFVQRYNTVFLVSWYTVLALLLVITFQDFLISLIG